MTKLVEKSLYLHRLLQTYNLLSKWFTIEKDIKTEKVLKLKQWIIMNQFFPIFSCDVSIIVDNPIGYLQSYSNCRKS